MLRLFDLDSPLMRALSALMDWFVVSFFTLLCALPVFTAGPALCALYGAMGANRGEGFSLKRFFADFRRCFRPACLCTLFFLAAGYFFYLYIQAVGALPGQVRVLFWAAALFFLACLALAAGVVSGPESPVDVPLAGSDRAAVGPSDRVGAGPAVTQFI